MSVAETSNPGISFESMIIKPPSHPRYDLKGVIKLVLAEDAGDRGDVTCLATIPFDMEVEAHFLTKEDGIIAGISLAEMIFHEVDPSLKTMVDAAHPACILDTRKTAPGLHLVDKCKLVEVDTRTLEEVDEVLRYTYQTKSSFSRVMLDKMAVPLPNGDVDVSMLKDAVEMINGRFETEPLPSCLGSIPSACGAGLSSLSCLANLFNCILPCYLQRFALLPTVMHLAMLLLKRCTKLDRPSSSTPCP
ncbi:hypothetical protein D5086_019893 [Populus alba]|uniref:Uncharacterized protein n=1 Tax=Populus alba TaxID=43335 RepID=A0ACC4BIV5_POPAL